MTLKTLLLTASTLALAAAAAPAMAADYSRFGIPADLPGTCSYEAIDAKACPEPSTFWAHRAMCGPTGTRPTA